MDHPFTTGDRRRRSLLPAMVGRHRKGLRRISASGQQMQGETRGRETHSQGDQWRSSGCQQGQCIRRSLSL